MSKQYSQNQKQDIINRYFSGEGVTTLAEETGISRSTIYNWIKVEQQHREKKSSEKETVNFKSYRQLKEHAERLEGMLTILKTCGCAPHDPLPVKLKVSERLYHEDNYSVRMICEALDVPRELFTTMCSGTSEVRAVMKSEKRNCGSVSEKCMRKVTKFSAHLRLLQFCKVRG